MQILDTRMRNKEKDDQFQITIKSKSKSKSRSRAEPIYKEFAHANAPFTAHLLWRESSLHYMNIAL